jgi:hypothetical protein
VYQIRVFHDSGSGDASEPQFTIPASSTEWWVAYTYDCSDYGYPGNFITDIKGYGKAASSFNVGANEIGMGSAGVDFYYDTGTFNIDVISECDWTLSVVALGRWVVPVYPPTPTTTTTTTTTTTLPPPTTPPGAVTLFEKAGSGEASQLQFTVPASASSWEMSWTYNCSNFGLAGNFALIFRDGSGNLLFLGENLVGNGGSGVDTYHSTGAFTFDVDSQCNWAIQVGYHSLSAHRASDISHLT